MARRRIAVMAAGGVGGYFGARLAVAGRDVTFVARGAHHDAIRRDGLRVESPLGDIHLQPARVESDPAAVGPVDAVLFAVKLADTEAAAAACKPLLKADTGVFTFQNGVESAERVGAVLGPRHAVPGVAYVATVIAAPGVIRHTGTMARMLFGEADGRRGARCEALFEDALAAGIDVELVDDPRLAIWNKFVRLAPFSGLTSLTRAGIGPVRETAATRTLLEGAVAEVVAVARAEGIDLPADTTQAAMRWMEALPADTTSSMAHDLAAGRRLELPWLSGAVARLGARHGVPTPTHDFIAKALAVHERGRPAPGGRE